MKNFFQVIGLSLFFLSRTIFSQVIQDGLVAYYPFNGNANDESGQGNNGIVHGGIQLTEDRFGNLNSAFYFDGIDDYIGIENSEGFDSTDNISIAFWIKRVGKGSIIAKAHPHSHGYWININSDGYLEYAISGFWYQNITDIYVSNNEWNHIILISDSEKVEIYLNGKLRLTQLLAWSGLIEDDAISISIGRMSPENHNPPPPPDLENFFNGCIDDVYFFTKALNKEEIKELVKPTQDGLVAYYPFNGNAHDESGNGNNGIVHGDIQLAEDRFGNPNSAFYFDGIDDYIEIENSLGFDSTDNITIEFWIKRVGKGTIIAKAHPHSHGYWININSDGFLEYAISGFWYQNITDIFISKNEWNHIKFMHDSEKVEIYLNGELRLAQLLAWSGFVEDDDINISIGRMSPENHTGSPPPDIENFFNGYIDDVCFYNKETTKVSVLNVVNHPSKYVLDQSYPNPFNLSTNIRYEIPTCDHIKLEIFNLIGQKIRTLINEIQSPGMHYTSWDGKNDNGKIMVSGTYIYRITSGNFRQSKKMILLK